MDNYWNPMETAPKDGRRVLLLIHHVNRQYARTDDERRYERTYAERERWTDEVEARWSEHNGGGWTWNGMMGKPMGWRGWRDQ